jgi:nitrogen-specific signal transduction histidine kinase
LRNPMTIIGGFARQILKKTSPQDENYKSLEIIASQTERMEDLFTNFLDYVYVPENVVEELDLNLSIEQSLELLKGELKEKRIYLIKNLQPQLPKLHLNPELLGSSLVNALRYMLSNSTSSGSLYITTQSFEGQVSLTLSLMPVNSILLPEKSSSFSLASTLIGNLGGILKYKPEDKARLCLETIFFPKGGKDGQHSNRG